MPVGTVSWQDDAKHPVGNCQGLDREKALWPTRPPTPSPFGLRCALAPCPPAHQPIPTAGEVVVRQAEEHPQLPGGHDEAVQDGQEGLLCKGVHRIARPAQAGVVYGGIESGRGY